MIGCNAFCVRPIYHFLQFFGVIYVTLFCYLMWHNFFIFATVAESTSMIIVDMRAFSVVPEINMSTAQPLSIAFELLPQFILQSLICGVHDSRFSHFQSLSKHLALICCYMLYHCLSFTNPCHN